MEENKQTKSEEGANANSSVAQDKDVANNNNDVETAEENMAPSTSAAAAGTISLEGTHTTATTTEEEETDVKSESKDKELDKIANAVATTAERERLFTQQLAVVYNSDVPRLENNGLDVHKMFGKIYQLNEQQEKQRSSDEACSTQSVDEKIAALAKSAKPLKSSATSLCEKSKRMRSIQLAKENTEENANKGKAGALKSENGNMQYEYAKATYEELKRKLSAHSRRCLQQVALQLPEAASRSNDALQTADNVDAVPKLEVQHVNQTGQLLLNSISEIEIAKEEEAQNRKPDTTIDMEIDQFLQNSDRNLEIFNSHGTSTANTISTGQLLLNSINEIEIAPEEEAQTRNPDTVIDMEEMDQFLQNNERNLEIFNSHGTSTTSTISTDCLTIKHRNSLEVTRVKSNKKMQLTIEEDPMRSNQQQSGARSFHAIQIETIPILPAPPVQRPPLLRRIFNSIGAIFQSIFRCLQSNKDCIFCIAFFFAFVVSASFLTAFFYRTLTVTPQVLYQQQAARRAQAAEAAGIKNGYYLS